MKATSDFLAHAASSSDIKSKLSSAKTGDELVKLAKDAGFAADESSVSAAMRSVAGAELRKQGLPDWAIESMFRGDAVCW